MERLKALLKNQTTYIVLLLIVTGVFFYLRSVNRNLIADEIMYFYVCGDGLDKASDVREIQTFSDILESQFNHYNRVNGRAIVHSIEQFFSGIAGVTVFYCINTIVFIFTIFIFVKMIFKQLDRYVYWIFTIVVFLYLFPELANLWFSINYSLNYFWPLCFTLLVLYYWNKLRYGTKISKISLILMPILGLIAGWSHEIFAISLSVVTFVFYCFNYKEFSKEVALLVVPLWIGTVFLVLAPGNFIRLQNNTIDIDILTYIKRNPLAIKLLPMLVILVLLFSKKHLINIKEFVRTNYILIGLFVTSLLFVLLLGVVPCRTYTAVELFSLLLIVELIKVANINKMRILQYEKPICIVLTLMIVVHQSFICHASVKENEIQDAFLNQYVKSEDGIAIYDYNNYGILINPYVRHFELEIGDNPGFKFHKESLELYYTRKKKRLVPISSADYELISNFSKCLKENDKIKYSGPFYSIEGCNYAWAYAETVDKTDQFQYCYGRVSFADEAPLHVKLKRWLIPESYPLKENVNEINEVKFNSRKFLAIRITPMRDVVDIKRIMVNN